MSLSSSPTVRTRDRILTWTSVVAVVLLATFLRQSGVPKAETIWAEDGSEFAACAYESWFGECLATLYAGFLHTVPHLAAEFAVLGAPEGLPFRLALIAGLLTAAAALLAARAVLDVTASAVAAVLASVGLVLVYPAAKEVLANIGNLHWVLLTSAVVVIVCSWLRRPPDVADAVLILLTVLSSPFAPFVLLPLLGVGWAIGAPRSRVLLAVAFVGAIPQVLALATGSRPAPGIERRDAASQLQTLVNVLRQWGWFGPGLELANRLVIVLVAAVAVLLAVARRRDGATAVMAIGGVGVVTFVVAAYISHGITYRYAFALSSLILTALVLGAGLLARETRPRLGRFMLVSLLLFFGVGFAASFSVENDASSGPNATTQIEGGCQGASEVLVWVSPRSVPPKWNVLVPC